MVNEMVAEADAERLAHRQGRRKMVIKRELSSDPERRALLHSVDKGPAPENVFESRFPNMVKIDKEFKPVVRKETITTRMLTFHDDRGVVQEGMKPQPEFLLIETTTDRRTGRVKSTLQHQFRMSGEYAGTHARSPLFKHYFSGFIS